MLKIPKNISIIAAAFAPLLVVIVLFIIVGNFGFKKIADIRQQTKTAESDKRILTQKLDILKSVQEDGEKLANLVTVALPDTSPSLSAISQLKILASKDGLLISDLKSGSSANDSKGLSSVNVSFKIEGPRPMVEAFINETKTFAPITLVDKVKMTESTPGITQAEITLKTFFAPFPTKIPAVNQAMADFTASEQEMLEELGSLTQPVFAQVSTTSETKENPFAQ